MDTPINQPVVRDRCPPPKSVADTEIELNSLLRLLLKTVYVRGLESASQLSFALKLPLSVVNELLEEAKERGVLEVLGSAGHRLAAEFRYGITERGRQWATDALDQSLYVGPAPVALEHFLELHAQQTIEELHVTRDDVESALRHLASALPIPVVTDKSAAGRRVVEEALAETPSVVVFDFPHAAVLAPDRIEVPSVMFTHNVEAEIFRRHVDVNRNPVKRQIWKNQALKMERGPTARIRFKNEWHGTSSTPSNFLRTQLFLRSWFERWGTHDDSTPRAVSEDDAASD